MLPDLVFSDINWTYSLLWLVAGAVFIVLGVIVLIPAVTARVLPKPDEARLADFLPYDAILEDGATIALKNGTLARCMAIRGVDQAFISPGDLETLLVHRKMMVDQLAGLDVRVRIFTMRRAVRPEQYDNYPTVEAGAVAKRWNRQFETVFRTVNVLMIHTTKRNRRAAQDTLDEAEQVIVTNLDRYGVQRLTQDQREMRAFGVTLGSFLGSLCSPLTRPRPGAVSGGFLSDALTADRLIFREDGRLECRNGSDVKYGTVIGIKTFGDQTPSALTVQLSSLAYEFTLLQKIQAVPKAVSLTMLRQNQYMQGASALSRATIEDYQTAINMIDGAGGESSSLVYFAQSLFIFAPTLEQLTQAEKEARAIFANNGATAVVDKGVTERSWFDQHPSHDLEPRPFRLLSHNVAALVTFERVPPGLAISAWGDGPIARFYTENNSAYDLQLHISDATDAVGHCVVIAPTGTGKTTLFEFLSLMASRHTGLKHFFFDRHLGCYNYVTSMGGSYVTFGGDELARSAPSAMNPFQCEKTPENVAFLRNWLASLAGADTAAELQEIDLAVDLAFDYPIEHRSLANVYPAAFATGSSVAKALERWVLPERDGLLFNAERDAISLDDQWLVGFDMTQILSDDSEVAAPVLAYLMHRITESIKRSAVPAMIFVDEAEPMCRNPQFADMLRVMYQELRKLYASSVISVFQRPEALAAGSNSSQLIRNNAATYFLFQNPGANPEDYAEFGLNPRELSYVLGKSRPARPMNRSVLVKRPLTGESVVIDIDLSRPLGPLLKLLSSAHADVMLASRLQESRDDWVTEYIRQASTSAETRNEMRAAAERTEDAA